MSNVLLNPFEVTKAVDFTDQQINDYWVDLSGSSFIDAIKPSSPMPMLILGGKGSGKTHMMRYYSYTSQKLRYKNIIDGIKKDGYIGLYMRCGGLNSSRFGGEGNDDKWMGVFAYYMDLWLSQLTLKTVLDINTASHIDVNNEDKLCSEIYGLFGGGKSKNEKYNLTLPSVLSYLVFEQRCVDVAVNNYPFTEELNVDIATSPGELVYTIPKLVIKYIPEFKDILFSFFIDEFENLGLNHQKYINTLLREKEFPCTFKIGSRLYGVKTYETYSAGEVNKAGSEYDPLHLDSILRGQTPGRYRKFAKSLCLRRLSEANYIFSDADRVDGSAKDIDYFFETYKKDKLSLDETKFVLNNYKDKERPHMVALRKSLLALKRIDGRKQIANEASIEEVINNVSCYDIPILEKANIFLLYQDWSAKKDIVKSSREIKKLCKGYLEDEGNSSRHNNALSHFANDFLAQILRECGQKQLYIGMDTFISMSSGLPRNLLIILKHVFQWSLYNGERPFQDKRKITIKAQRKGVMEAADWFFRDARIAGEDGNQLRAAISRLATLLRRIRFSDKPPECSLSTFSVNLSNISRESQRVITLAENWSLLINISGGRRDRNNKGIIAKYQLNPMLAPRWDLPVNRRGDISLSSEEVNSIFDDDCSDEFDRYANIRISRMTAPSFKSAGDADEGQQALF